MPRPLSFGRTEVGLNLGTSPIDDTPSSDLPLRIAVLGDFTAHGRRPGLAERAPVLIDRDNFDEVLAQHGITLSLSTGDEATRLTVRLSSLDDFHPDHLWQNLEVFQALRQLRADLDNPATFERAAARIRNWATGTPAQAAPRSPPGTESEATPPGTPAQVDAAALLEEVLGQTQPARPSPGGELEAFLHKVVQPHLVPNIDSARQAELVSIVDTAAAAQMRAILHHPQFHAVEAVWRVAYLLIRRLETGVNLKVYLLDISKADLAADLRATDDLTATGLYHLLVKEPADQPYGLLVGLYSFDHSHEDVELLGRLARIAARAGALFLAEASSRILGCESLARKPDPADWQPIDPEHAQNWETLRQLPEARYLGLILPRRLLRLPYGKNASSVEQFDFEEMPTGADHEMFLWGNPAVSCAFLIGEAFNRHGWSCLQGVQQEIEGLPLYVYRSDGELQCMPCAEVLLSERAIRAIQDKGLMPLVSVKDRDVLHLCGLRSIAAGPEGERLGGRFT